MDYSRKRKEDESYEEYRERQRFIKSRVKNRGINVWPGDKEPYVKGKHGTLKETSNEIRSLIQSQLNEYDNWKTMNKQDVDDLMSNTKDIDSEDVTDNTDIDTEENETDRS
jgi:hypothetical protein